MNFFSDGATVPFAHNRVQEVRMMLNYMQPLWPQMELDGIKNVWIVKPGAKSRGRGKIAEIGSPEL